MDTSPDYTVWDHLVKCIFVIEDYTLGSAKDSFLIRYRGRLTAPDSAQAYDQLAEALKPLNLIPLFRIEAGQQVILIEKSLPVRKTIPPVINLIMFILTLFSVLASGGLAGIDSLPKDPIQAVLLLIQTGWPFAVSLLGILLMHEFGHYLVSRAHGSKVSLPFFIPLPMTQLGTLGAVIFAREPDKNKRVAMDNAIAGPLAGFVASLVVLMIGLSLSNLDRIPLVVDTGHIFQIEGNSLLYLILKYLRFGELLPQPVNYGGLSPLIYWLKYFFTGQPLPLGGMDVMIHPVAWAGWVGLLITSLNLIPAGQLDGGHIFYALFGKDRARKMLPVIVIVLAGMGFLWSGWWLWAGLIFLTGRVYAEPFDQITELDRPHKILGIAAFLVFILTLVPIPLVMIAG